MIPCPHSWPFSRKSVFLLSLESSPLLKSPFSSDSPLVLQWPIEEQSAALSCHARYFDQRLVLCRAQFPTLLCLLFLGSLTSYDPMHAKDQIQCFSHCPYSPLLRFYPTCLFCRRCQATTSFTVLSRSPGSLLNPSVSNNSRFPLPFSEHRHYFLFPLPFLTCR